MFTNLLSHSAAQDRASITHETLPSLQLPETLALLGDEARPGPEEGPSYAWKVRNVRI